MNSKNMEIKEVKKPATCEEYNPGGIKCPIHARGKNEKEFFNPGKLCLKFEIAFVLRWKFLFEIRFVSP